MGILLILVSVIPVTILAVGVGSLAGKYDDAMAVWVSSHLMGIAILVVVWNLGLKRYRVSFSMLGFGAPQLNEARLKLKT